MLDGEVVSGLPTIEVVRRGVSMVPENRRLFADMTVVGEPATRGVPPSRPQGRRSRTTRTVLETFPRVRERLKQKAGTLSGGEQQMVAMCRALMANPKVLLMDEPSMGLAPVLVEQVFEIIKQIRALGTTIFVVEQNANMALSIADRGYVIQTGTGRAGRHGAEPAGQPADAGGLPRGAVMRLLDADELRAAPPDDRRDRRPGDGVPRRRIRRTGAAADQSGDAGRDAPADAGVRRGGGRREAGDAHVATTPSAGCRSSTRSTSCSTPSRRHRRPSSTARRSPRSGPRRSPDWRRGTWHAGRARGSCSSARACRPRRTSTRCAPSARSTEVVVVSRTAGQRGGARRPALERGLGGATGGAGVGRRRRPRLHVHDERGTAVRRDAPPPGVHVNAVGVYRPDARELDTETRAAGAGGGRDAGGGVRRGRRAGDPDRRGGVRRRTTSSPTSREPSVGREVRRSTDDITVFKSVGMAFEDLIVARAIVDAPSI